MIPSPVVQGETSPDVGGANAGPAAPPTPKRESVASFSDVSKLTDPRLVIRRQRMRRVFTWVMGGAVGLLVLAGLCSLVRRADPPPAVQTKVAEPSAPVAEPVAPIANPATAEPAAAEAPEPLVPQASAATSKTPAPRTTHRPKPAPRKTRTAGTR